MALTTLTATNIGYVPVNKAGDVFTGGIATNGATASAPITAGRVNNSNEGGQVDLCRSTDNASAWAIDVYGNTSTPSLRIIDNIATASRLIIDSGGRVTMPYQPMFDVYKNNGNVAASQTIVFNGVRSNIGSCYSTSTGRFTAPVSGAYQFNTQVTTVDSGAFLEIQLAVNGSNRYSGRTYRTGTTQDSAGVSACIYLSAGDYITVTTSVGNAYGVDERCALFSGHLIG